MKKRVLWPMIPIIVMLILMGMFFFYKRIYLRNTVDVNNLSEVTIIDIEPIQYIELPETVNNNLGFTATGICYNSIDNDFYIGNYGKTLRNDKDIHPGIVHMNSDLSTVDDVLLFDDNDITIQGIAYDKTTNSIWYTNRGEVINCTINDGKTISKFTLGTYSKYEANGICIDTNDGSIWVLCMYKYLLNYNKDGSLIKAFNCEFIGQDHICMDAKGNIYISVGVDYHGNENFVICLDKNCEIQTIYRVEKSHAIEGIVINNAKLYVVNDGIYHEAKIRKNYIQVYDIQF